MERTRLVPLIASGFLLHAATLDAQAVRGALVDRASGQPIEAAFVTLLDDAGGEVARALTSLGGTFLLRAPAPGIYRVRSKRIGFRPSESPPLALADSQTLDYRLEADAVPVLLPAVIVRGQPQCGASAGGAEVAQLWEETREALAAVRWTQDQSTLRYSVDWFERALPRSGRQVLEGRDSTWFGAGARPFASVPAEQLAKDGYVVAAAGDSVDYFGPDAEVLLGDVFMSTHCFSARDGGTERPGLVGLAFEPEPRRRLPDVAGVLWLRRETLELTFLEFNYTRLRYDSLGGHVEFARLPSGPWIITHWWIRTPQVEPRRRSLRPRRPNILGYRESGGMVTTIRSAAGAVEYSGERAYLDGTVVDSSRGGSPLFEAIVSLTGSTRLALADEVGRFEISGPFDGEYDVWFRHPRLDSLGLAADPQRVTLSRGSRQAATLYIPPETAVLQRICPDGLGGNQLVIVGVVRDSTGSPVERARVTIQPIAGEGRRTARADSAGRFTICSIPSGPLTLTAVDGDASGAVTLEFKEGGVWVDATRFHHLTGRIWKQDLWLAR